MPDLVEVWRPVPGTEGRYEASDLGRVRRVPGRYGQGRVLEPNVSHGGYLFVSLSVRNRRRSVKIHRIVATVFLGPRLDGLTTNHRDGDKRNNAASNLEYVTPRENTAHAVALGLIDFQSLGRMGRKLNTDAVREIRGSRGITQHQLASRFGVSQATISAVRQGRRYSDVA